MPSYLVRRPSGWHFRIRVPDDLQSVLARRELRCSLVRRSKPEATRLARHLYCGADRIFHRLRARAHAMQPMTDLEIQRLLDSHLRTLLSVNEEDRAVSGRIDPWVQEHEGLDFQYLKESSQDALAYNDLDQAGWEVDKALADQGIKLDTESTEYKKLCRGMLQTRAQYAEIEVARSQGDYSKHPVPAAPVILPRAVPPEPDPDAAKVSELRDKYLDDGYKSKGWKRTTGHEYATSLNLFVEVENDPPVNRITRDQMKDFRDKLTRLPSNRTKKVPYRGKSAHDLLAMAVPQADVMNPRTVQKSIERFSTFLKWVRDEEGLIERNPAEGIGVAGVPTKSTRKPFAAGDLAKLFGSTEYRDGTHRKPHHFWLPLLGLYTGARLGELAQLRVDDVIERRGIWMLQITDDGDDQQVKTDAAIRTVPIHPELVRMGWLRFVEAVKLAGKTRMFDEVKRDSKGNYSGHPSRWFARYRAKCGIREHGKDFHSFRHTVITGLLQHDVAKEKVQEIVGHEMEGVTLGTYFHGSKPEVLHHVICKLDYGPDLSSLTWTG